MTTTKIKDKNNKYFVAIQKFIDDNNYGLKIQQIDIAYSGRNARSILVTFEHHRATRMISECYVRCNFDATPHTISGGAYAYLSDEDNDKLRAIRYFIGNMFWIWLCYYDFHFNKEFNHFNKERLFELLNGGFEERKKKHPWEFHYTSTFKELVDNFNNQVNDGLFGDKTLTMDTSNVNFNGFKYIDPMNNLFH